MKRINTTNINGITRLSNRGITTVFCFVLLQLALYTMACEDMEDNEEYIETEEAEGMDVDNIAQPLNGCAKRGQHCKCGGWRHRCRGSLPRVKKFVLVNTETGEDIRDLQDGDIIDLQEDGPSISIRAVVRGHARKVVFSLNSNPRYHTEHFRPYYIAGNQGSEVFPWEVQPGDYVLKATPYRSKHRHGRVGRSKTIEFKVVDQDVVEHENIVFRNAYNSQVLSITKQVGNVPGDVIQTEQKNNDEEFWTIREVPGEDPSDIIYEIANQNSGLCLALDNEGGVLEEVIIQKDCDFDDESQQWRIVYYSASDSYRIISVVNEGCMDVFGNGESELDGALIIQHQPANARPTQLWHIEGEFNQ